MYFPIFPTNPSKFRVQERDVWDEGFRLGSSGVTDRLRSRSLMRSKQRFVVKANSLWSFPYMKTCSGGESCQVGTPRRLPYNDDLIKVLYIPKDPEDKVLSPYITLRYPKISPVSAYMSNFFSEVLNNPKTLTLYPKP